MANGVARTVGIALCTYTNPDGNITYGLNGQDVMVHPDHVEAFDRLNRAAEFEDDPRAWRGGHVDVSAGAKPVAARPGPRKPGA